MPQIAQQDYLQITISIPDELTADEKKQLKDAHDRGVLMDALIVLNGGDTIARVVTDDIGNSDTVYIVFGDLITPLDVS